MNSTMERQFLTYLKIPIHERTDEDLAVIYAFLQSLEGLSNLRGNALRAICRTLRYEHHQANDLLYRRGDVNTCWYILLTGSVFIDNSMYLPRSSFGKRTGGATRRPNDCLILEPSDMIVIDYPDVPLMRPTPRVGAPVVRAIQRQSASCATAMSLEGYGDLYRNNNHLHLNHHNNHHQQQQQQHQQQQQQQHQHQQQHQQQQQQLHHHSSAYQSMMPERQDQYQFPLQVPGRVETSGATYMPHQEAHYPHPHVKRNSRASDTSSAYSGSDLMQSSLDDTGLEQDYGQMTMESLADSDDDENYSESNDSYCVRDTVRDCLEKDPSERTDDDLETLLDFMQHFPAFMNMTLATRREFCAVMVFAVVEKAGTIVMNDGEELDSWSVILNGCVEIERPDGNIEELHMGDCFGITPTMEKLYHKGIMRTMVDDCQFVCIAQADYFSILHHGEERTVRHEEEGLVTLVTEKRELDGGNRKGQMVIRGTTDRLTTHLVEEHSSVDPSYVEDFLLTYRTFLKSPLEVANKLLMWFNDPQLRDRVTRVVLLWVNNHFNDFETDAQLNEFLEKFEKLLEREHMSGQMRLLSIACAAKARPRTVVLTRSTKDEILHFSILGGLERDCPIFISKVERGSKAHEAGLKRGDQILEVNGTNFEQITHSRALEILRGTTHLSITARSNLLAYRDSCMSADPLSTRPTKQQTSTGGKFIPERQRLSVPELEGVQPVIQAHKEKKNKDSKGINQTHKTKIRKALIRMNILPKGSQNDNLHSTEDLYSTSSRSSTTSSSSLTAGTLGSHLSASNPDLSSIYSDEGKYDFPEHVLRVYRADQTCKYFLVHKETTAREVVMLAIREFGISDPSSNYSLCEVSVVSENMIKQKRLPDQLGNLPERISLNGRYYLKNNMITETLVPDDLAPELYKESQITFLQLNSTEIAAQMTLDDFKVFQDIEPTEYVDELFNLKSKYGTQKLQQFAELVNKEMFWVVTEILIEPVLIKRMRVIKHFVKIAKHSKDCKNFNSMFAIISGLGHATVSRLRQTWDKLPSKYIKMFTDMQDMMDPSRNMSKYRNVINSDRVQPPMLPFYPVVKKDMTFIHLGNDSSVDGLINFEKLRMIAKEVKHICNMSSAKYDAGTMFFGSSIPATTFAMFAQSSTIYSGVATMRRKARRGSALPNPKKMYEEAQMVRRVKTYLNTLEIIYDEEKLKIMSHQCEAPNNMNTLRKRDPSPTQSTNSYEDKQRPTYTGPKFGTSSPDAVRKMMALSDKSRPVNPKYASHLHTSSPKAARPHASPKHQHSAGTLGMGTRPPPLQPAVNLSSESSSVVSLTGLVRKSRTSDSLSTGATPSPTSNATFQQQLELDSGHNSVASSSYDARSMSSVGSGSSPVSQRKISPQSVAHETTTSSAAPVVATPARCKTPPPPAPSTSAPPIIVVNSKSNSELSGGQGQGQKPDLAPRPQLPPSYHTAVNNNSQPAFSHYIHQQYTNQGTTTTTTTATTKAVPPPVAKRPPLPDYYAATRRKQMSDRGRAHSLEGAMSPYYPGYEGQEQRRENSLDEESEQVSAV